MSKKENTLCVIDYTVKLEDGTVVDSTGLISYLTPNTIGINTGLYNQTFQKIVDQNSIENTDPTRNKMEIRHISGATYTDIIISCFLFSFGFILFILK